MERQEIEAELNEVERDLAAIARRAKIAAGNLRSLADSMERKDCMAATLLAALAVNCEHLDRDASRACGALVVSHKELAAFGGRAEGEAGDVSRAQGASLASETETETETEATEKGDQGK